MKKTKNFVKPCENWKTVKSIDKGLEIRNSGSVIKCPYCGKKHKD